MLIVEIAILGTLLFASILGIVVYFTNTRRVVNQYFLVFAGCVTLWQLSGWFIIQAATAEAATLAIRWASVFAAIIPTSCHLLRLSIKCPQCSFTSILRIGIRYLIINILTTALCFTEFFLKTTVMPDNVSSDMALAEPKYGAGLSIYAFYFLLSGISLIVAFKRDMKTLDGVQRAELSFVVLGATIALLIGSVLGLFIPLIAGTSQYVPFTNALSIVALVATVGYGIAIHKILGILTIIRRAIAYALLIVYLVIVYLITWSLGSLLLSQFMIYSHLPAQIIATLVVAFSMTPAHGRLQKVAEKLIASKSMDVSSTMRAASKMFQSVTTIDAILDHFLRLLVTALGTERIGMLAYSDLGYSLRYCTEQCENTITFEPSNAVIEMIKKSKEPISKDSLLRTRPTAKIQEAIDTLTKYDVQVATGIFAKEGLTGVVLLGPKTDGRIYDSAEQDALQLLCNQFSVALENAQLYTEVQDSKIRNEIMLDQLVSGVILANTERKITLFNHEAQRITGIQDKDAIGMDIDVLPKAIARSLEDALKREKGQRNVDARLFELDEAKKSLSIRMGTTFLLSHDQKPMGALLVFTDLTELKSLEEQVRRTDQLSSVGTLAAGMAHEIKNPLVTIKTFTQLLPSRYSDEDFRLEFSELVAHEVSRIDGIVNELLSFSKPTKPHLVPMKLHDTIDQILKLTHEQMIQKNIGMNNRCHADVDEIQGDAKLLSQALINLMLNAIEAIGNDGTITVGSSNCKYQFATGEHPNHGVNLACIRVQISDTGHGIPRESLQKIFDPFFTSKSEGTGMGLSVAHGIIQDHGGVIEVESETGAGSTFYVYLPVIQQEAS